MAVAPRAFAHAVPMRRSIAASWRGECRSIYATAAWLRGRTIRPFVRVGASGSIRSASNSTRGSYVTGPRRLRARLATLAIGMAVSTRRADDGRRRDPGRSGRHGLPRRELGAPRRPGPDVRALGTSGGRVRHGPQLVLGTGASRMSGPVRRSRDAGERAVHARGPRRRLHLGLPRLDLRGPAGTPRRLRLPRGGMGPGLQPGGDPGHARGRRHARPVRFDLPGQLLGAVRHRGERTALVRGRVHRRCASRSDVLRIRHQRAPVERVQDLRCGLFRLDRATLQTLGRRCPPLGRSPPPYASHLFIYGHGVAAGRAFEVKSFSTELAIDGDGGYPLPARHRRPLSRPRPIRISSPVDPSPLAAHARRHRLGDL